MSGRAQTGGGGGTAGPAAFGAAVSAGRRRVPETTLRDWLALAQDACDEADAIAMAHLRHDLRIERKPDRTFVTIADRKIERAIRLRIGGRHPDHGIIGEEEGSEGAERPVRWTIDPIDGTHNYLRGIPVFATLLAVEADGELQVAVVSAPAMHTRWWAARGLGAWARTPEGERRIEVSAVGELADAQVVYASRAATLEDGRMPGFDRVVEGAWRDRGFGDFWGYMLVAEGAAEAMFEVGISAYDIAAPALIVEEAGGRLTDGDGERRLDARSCVATNGCLHEALLRALRTD